MSADHFAGVGSRDGYSLGNGDGSVDSDGCWGMGVSEGGMGNGGGSSITQIAWGGKSHSYQSKERCDLEKKYKKVNIRFQSQSIIIIFTPLKEDFGV